MGFLMMRGCGLVDNVSILHLGGSTTLSTYLENILRNLALHGFKRKNAFRLLWPRKFSGALEIVFCFVLYNNTMDRN